MKGGAAMSWLERSALLFGQETMDRLAGATVAVLGLGGVGGSAAEALCRMGIGRLILVDNDLVDDSNRNRQLLATAETVGLPKVEAAARRLKAINPAVELLLCREFYLPENSDFLFEQQPDLVLDAIDTVTAKLHLAQSCRQRDIPLVTCLGTGNRLDPSQLRWGTVEQTAGCGCPLARVLRRELRKRGLGDQQVIYSVEEPIRATVPGSEHGRHSPGSCAFVPPAAGCLLASRGVSLLLERWQRQQ